MDAKSEKALKKLYDKDSDQTRRDPKYSSLNTYRQFLDKQIKRLNPADARAKEASIVHALIRMETQRLKDKPNTVLREDGMAKTAVTQFAQNSGFITGDKAREIIAEIKKEQNNPDNLRDNLTVIIESMPAEFLRAFAPVAILAQQNTGNLEKRNVSEVTQYTPDQINKIFYVGNAVIFNAVANTIGVSIDQEIRKADNMKAPYVGDISCLEATKINKTLKEGTKDDLESNAFVYYKVQQAHNATLGVQAQSTPNIGQSEERLKTIAQTGGQRVVKNMLAARMLNDSSLKENRDIANNIELMSLNVDQLQENFNPQQAEALAEKIQSTSKKVSPNSKAEEQLATVKSDFVKTVESAESDGKIDNKAKNDLLDKAGMNKGKEEEYGRGAPTIMNNNNE